MERSEVLKSPGYWIADWQLKLFRMLNSYLEEEHMTKSQFAQKLGCSNGYVSQILNGDFDHKMSKLIELSLAAGKIPQLEFVDVDTMIWKDKNGTKATIALRSDMKANAKFDTSGIVKAA